MPKCSKCNAQFEGRPERCPSCNVKFGWDKTPSADSTQSTPSAPSTEATQTQSKIAVESSDFLEKFGPWLRPLLIICPILGPVVGWILAMKFKDYKTSMRVSRQRRYSMWLRSTVLSTAVWLVLVVVIIVVRLKNPL